MCDPSSSWRFCFLCSSKLYQLPKAILNVVKMFFHISFLFMLIHGPYLLNERCLLPHCWMLTMKILWPHLHLIELPWDSWVIIAERYVGYASISLMLTASVNISFLISLSTNRVVTATVLVLVHLGHLLNRILPASWPCLASQHFPAAYIILVLFYFFLSPICVTCQILQILTINWVNSSIHITIFYFD